MPRFDIDTIGHEPDALGRRRPDAAERQRRIAEAVAHDLWFRSEVEAALIAADDPATPLVSNADAKQAWAQQRAFLLARTREVAGS